MPIYLAFDLKPPWSTRAAAPGRAYVASERDREMISLVVTGNEFHVRSTRNKWIDFATGSEWYWSIQPAAFTTSASMKTIREREYQALRCYAGTAPITKQSGKIG
jgi:hypothetical protein